MRPTRCWIGGDLDRSNLSPPSEQRPRDDNEINFFQDVPQILHRLKAEGIFVAACSRTSAPSV